MFPLLLLLLYAAAAALFQPPVTSDSPLHGFLVPQASAIVRKRSRYVHEVAHEFEHVDEHGRRFVLRYEGRHAAGGVHALMLDDNVAAVECELSATEAGVVSVRVHNYTRFLYDQWARVGRVIMGECGGGAHRLQARIVAVDATSRRERRVRLRVVNAYVHHAFEHLDMFVEYDPGNYSHAFHHAVLEKERRKRGFFPIDGDWSSGMCLGLNANCNLASPGAIIKDFPVYNIPDSTLKARSMFAMLTLGIRMRLQVRRSNGLLGLPYLHYFDVQVTFGAAAEALLALTGVPTAWAHVVPSSAFDCEELEFALKKFGPVFLGTFPIWFELTTSGKTGMSAKALPKVDLVYGMTAFSGTLTVGYEYKFKGHARGFYSHMQTLNSPHIIVEVAGATGASSDPTVAHGDVQRELRAWRRIIPKTGAFAEFTPLFVGLQIAISPVPPADWLSGSTSSKQDIYTLEIFPLRADLIPKVAVDFLPMDLVTVGGERIVSVRLRARLGLDFGITIGVFEVSFRFPFEWSYGLTVGELIPLSWAWPIIDLFVPSWCPNSCALDVTLPGVGDNATLPSSGLVYAWAPQTAAEDVAGHANRLGTGPEACAAAPAQASCAACMDAGPCGWCVCDDSCRAANYSAVDMAPATCACAASGVAEPFRVAACDVPLQLDAIEDAFVLPATLVVDQSTVDVTFPTDALTAAELERAALLSLRLVDDDETAATPLSARPLVDDAYAYGGVPELGVALQQMFTFAPRAGLRRGRYRLVAQTSADVVRRELWSTVFLLDFAGDPSATVGWALTPWSACAAACTSDAAPEPVQLRDYECVNGLGEAFDAARCLPTPKPSCQYCWLRDCDPMPPACVDAPLALLKQASTTASDDAVIPIVFTGGEPYRTVHVEYLDPYCKHWQLLLRVKAGDERQIGFLPTPKYYRYVDEYIRSVRDGAPVFSMIRVVNAHNASNRAVSEPVPVNMQIWDDIAFGRPPSRWIVTCRVVDEDDWYVRPCAAGEYVTGSLTVMTNNRAQYGRGNTINSFRTGVAFDAPTNLVRRNETDPDLDFLKPQPFRYHALYDYELIPRYSDLRFPSRVLLVNVAASSRRVLERLWELVLSPEGSETLSSDLRRFRIITRPLNVNVPPYEHNATDVLSRYEVSGFPCVAVANARTCVPRQFYEEPTTEAVPCAFDTEDFNAAPLRDLPFDANQATAEELYADAQFRKQQLSADVAGGGLTTTLLVVVGAVGLLCLAAGAVATTVLCLVLRRRRLQQASARKRRYSSKSSSAYNSAVYVPGDVEPTRHHHAGHHSRGASRAASRKPSKARMQREANPIFY